MGHLGVYAHDATEVWSSRIHNLGAVAHSPPFQAKRYAREVPGASALARALACYVIVTVRGTGTEPVAHHRQDELVKAEVAGVAPGGRPGAWPGRRSLRAGVSCVPGYCGGPAVRWMLLVAV